MKFNGIDINQIIGAIKDIAILIVSLVLAVVLCGTSLKAAGHSVPYLPVMDPTPLAYLCGAFWLYRK